MRADVSVVVPVFNRPVEAVNAAVLGLKADAEHLRIQLVVVDDCSSRPLDADLLQAEGISISVVRLSRNAGVSGAQNAGVARAEGEYVCFVHSDDRLVANGVRARMDLAASTGADVIGGAIVFGERIQQDPLVGASAQDFLRHRFGTHIAQYLFRREVLCDEPFDARLRCWEDWDLLYRLARSNTACASVESIVAQIGDDVGQRLSTSIHMATSLEQLRAKYAFEIEADRTIEGVWAFKLARLYSSQFAPEHRAAARRWAIRAMFIQPWRIRRFVASTKRLVRSAARSRQTS